MNEVQAFIARNKHQLGYIMGEASRQWAAIDPVGALTVGPCVKQVEVYGEYFKLVDENTRMREALEEASIIEQWTHEAFKKVFIPTSVLRAIEKQKQALRRV